MPFRRRLRWAAPAEPGAAAIRSCRSVASSRAERRWAPGARQRSPGRWRGPGRSRRHGRDPSAPPHPPAPRCRWPRQRPDRRRTAYGWADGAGHAVMRGDGQALRLRLGQRARRWRRWRAWCCAPGERRRRAWSAGGSGPASGGTPRPPNSPSDLERRGPEMAASPMVDAADWVGRHQGADHVAAETQRGGADPALERRRSVAPVPAPTDPSANSVPPRPRSAAPAQRRIGVVVPVLVAAVAAGRRGSPPARSAPVPAAGGKAAARAPAARPRPRRPQRGRRPSRPRGPARRPPSPSCRAPAGRSPACRGRRPSHARRR